MKHARPKTQWWAGALLTSLACCSPARLVNATNSSRATIIVKAAQPAESSEVIGDLIGSQYAPFTFDAAHIDPWGVAAWQEIGFNVGDIALFNFEDTNPYTDAGKIVGIHVVRRSDGTLELDYSDFDRNIRFLQEVLHVRRIDFTAWGTPKALADPAAGEFYFFHAPRSYAEWNDILFRAVRHISSDLHIQGATYKAWTEPDSGWYWRGHGRPGQIVTRASDPARIRALLVSEPRILDDYVEKYINDWRVIKAADSAAKVSGAFSVWSKAVPGSPTAFTLDDFLTRLDVFNREHANARVSIDEIAYQDYNWEGNGLSEGVVAANALVKQHHLPVDVPLVITGWNKDMKNDPDLVRRAAYVASNIIAELVPSGRKRTLARAYIWPFDYDYGVPIAPVVIPYRATQYSGDDGVGDPFSVPAVTNRQKRPMHAALSLLARMKKGRLISATSDDLAIKVLAVLQENSMILLTMANYGKRAFDVSLQLAEPKLAGHGGSLRIQRVDTMHSADGSGLEKGTIQHAIIDTRGEVLTLRLPPWSVVGIDYSPD